MSGKIRVYIDSGANHDSKNEEVITFEEAGIESKEEFEKMTEEELFTLVTDTLWRFEWGARIVEE